MLTRVYIERGKQAAIATATGNVKNVRKRFQVAREILTNLIK